MKFHLTNKSSSLNQSDYNSIIEGLKIYLKNFSIDWNFNEIEVESIDNGLDSLFPNTVILFDSIDSDNCMDYDFENDHNSVARIFVKTILDSGGVALYTDDYTFTIGQQISSTVLGIISNPDMNKWFMDQNKVLWWGDVCSPVYGNILSINTHEAQIGFADYVLPSYFGSSDKPAPYNKNNSLMGPFAIDENGYTIKYENNNFVSLFGENCPQEKLDQIQVYIDEFRSRFN